MYLIAASFAIVSALQSITPFHLKLGPTITSIKEIIDLANETCCPGCSFLSVFLQSFYGEEFLSLGPAWAGVA
jgi:hypothetical protein